MAKKTFRTAPKPQQLAAEDIEAYETAGPGHDRNDPGDRGTDTHQQAKRSAESTKRLSLDLPATTHTRFKTACSATGRKMVEEIEVFIERRMVELENEAGITRK